MYYCAGVLCSLSLIHGGPAPNFFSPLMKELVIGNDVPEHLLNIKLVQNESIKKVRTQILKTEYQLYNL